jgi:glycosyltransferase involved in cell wall biosynthesis
MSRLLFVYGDLHHGGIETLIVRLTHYLAEHGRTLAVCVRGGELTGQINRATELLQWTDRSDAVWQAMQWISRSAEPVTLVSFDPISAALGLAVEARNAGRISLVHLSGVYHPRAFFMTGERLDRIWLNRLVAKAVGDPLMYYMNQECRAEHERRWRTSLETSAIIPLPIQEVEPAWEPGYCEGLRIVSIGRLVDFKTYNLSAAEITRECVDGGLPICWDIYGTGPLTDAIGDTIDRHAVEKSVTLKGALPYARFASTVVDYDLFVGMGTSALEAAMLGVPTIVVTESERRRSYGYICDLPFGNVGERQSFPPPYDLGDQIRLYASLDLVRREEIGRKCRNAVLDYSYRHWVEELDQLARYATQRPSMTFKKAVSTLYEGMTASPLASLVRRLLAFALG